MLKWLAQGRYKSFDPPSVAQLAVCSTIWLCRSCLLPKLSIRFLLWASKEQRVLDPFRGWVFRRITACRNALDHHGFRKIASWWNWIVSSCTKFARVTKDAARPGHLANQWHSMAISLGRSQTITTKSVHANMHTFPMPVIKYLWYTVVELQ